MQKITVKSVEERKSKDGSKTFYILTDNKGGNFSSFDNILALKPGTVIEAEIEVSGKYANLREYKIIEAPSIPQPIANGERKPTWQGGDSPEKRTSIERQSCLERAVELAIAGKEHLSTDQIILTAERFYQWVSGQLKAIITNEIPPLKLPSSKPQPASAKTSESQPANPDDLFGDTAGLDTVKLQADFRKLKPDKRAALVLEYGITTWEHWDEVILALPADRQQALVKAVYEN